MRAPISLALALLCVPAVALAGDKYVHLTFDDGPNPATTHKVLDLLRQRNIKATFFVQGQNAYAHPDIIRRIVKEGHSLGNHTWDHPQLNKLSGAEVQKHLDGTQWAVDTALLKPEAMAKGKHFPMRTVRPPYGATNNTVRGTIESNLTPAGKVLAAKGKLPDGAGRQKQTMWTVDSNDWRKQGLDAILKNIFPGVYQNGGKGNVILFHDIHASTVRDLPAVLDRLANEGFEFRKVDAVKGYIGR